MSGHFVELLAVLVDAPVPLSSVPLEERIVRLA